MNLRSLPRASVALLLAAPLLAQGSNDCSTAQAIAGTGTFAFANASATTGTQGQSEHECTHFGQTGIFRDVWYAWTAPTTATYLVQTCSLTPLNTKMAVYAGAGCPTGSALTCNDDFCGAQSALLIAATAGSTYTLQLGMSSSGLSGGSGSFSIALAPPIVPCTSAVGPDVAVGDLWSITNYTASGGIDGVSVGTVGCNVGSAIANWVGDTNDHPIVRQNLYRYTVVGGAGRFEQVGLSWLKHTFGAQQDSDCCTCNPGGNFYHLGPGCSDPYDSSTNGFQTILGPNWEVNAHTGTYPYPFTSPPIANAFSRRCQVATSELAPTTGSTHCVIEAHYVSKDDAAFGNQNNNATWRELAITGNATNFNFALAGTSHWQESAIHAWDDFDAGVLTSEAQVPNDGLLVVASNATNVGGGTWRYEYAVYNMNADRGVGEFVVHVPGNVAVSALGFHDVAYHDGDGNGSVDFSGLDWASSASSGLVQWACETEAANPNANALRWGTLYNFRFDSDAPPTTGVVTLGLWKSGAVPSVTLAAKVPGTPPFGAFCAGDGSTVPCPCANDGASGRGCASSLFASGALLGASGNASVASDSVTLSANSMTGSACVFFQGDATSAPIVVDDGLGCVAGSIVRLGTKPIASAASSYPQAGDATVSVRGLVPPAGGTRVYQCFYRNASAAFCPPATSNRTNGVSIVWAP